jgi:2-dehydro-3-deoxyphosphogluconate aldolase / (4S)-4-hydroxy-2-oxoglutarate aldolase
MEKILLRTILQQKILPAVTITVIDQALPVAEAILKGGLQVMEVPFRTKVAPEAISAIRKYFPEMYVGAGTLLSPEQLGLAIASGAQFGLAPGFNPSVCRNALDNDFPFIPGVMSPSEIELASEMNFRILKLFPAAQLDGIRFLKAIMEAYGHLQIQFIPMGGVSLTNMSDYLNLNNVIAVGGSWLTTKELMAAGQFDIISSQVREALLKTN